MQTKNQLLAEALNLPPAERAQLVEELLASFEVPERERLDNLWGDECESRINVYERGELLATPLESVFEKINAWKSLSPTARPRTIPLQIPSLYCGCN